jgi:hypothetical protein
MMRACWHRNQQQTQGNNDAEKFYCHPHVVLSFY